MLDYVVAGVVAAAAASTYLVTEHKRHPFGDEKGKALIFWSGLAFLDVVVAEALLTGMLTPGSTASLDNASGVARAAAVGFLAPLAVRAPVREIRIGDKREKIGFTEIYDRLRVRWNRDLDERITELRRADRAKVHAALNETGWNHVTLTGRIDEHVENASRFNQPADEKRVRDALRAATTVPSKDRLIAVIKVALDEGMTGVIGHCKQHRPTKDDRQRGTTFLRGATGKSVRRPAQHR